MLSLLTLSLSPWIINMLNVKFLLKKGNFYLLSLHKIKNIYIICNDQK